MPASIPSNFSSTQGSVVKEATAGALAERAAARSTYLKVIAGGIFFVVLLIFSVVSIFWGALWKIPSHQLNGWIVDFDGGSIGQTVVSALNAQSTASTIAWTVLPASQFEGGAEEIGALVLEEHTWVAVVVQEGSTERLAQSLTSPNATYDGADAITVFAVEARNENAFRILIRPTIQAALGAISSAIGVQTAHQMANSTNIASVLTISPQTIATPISYRINNIAPFDIPLATAVTLMGLIYQLITSVFVVIISFIAREMSGLNKSLTTRTLIIVRLGTAFGAYFVVSIFYSLLSLAFQLDTSRKFGHSGFLVFWMLNYVSMLAVGLALESLVTILTTKFIPFFMLAWIITNDSVCIFPIEVMPHIFRYGHAAPFYNVSRAMRTIIFGTKNQVGASFGILLVWVAISCITLPLLQWFVRRTPAGSMQQPLPSVEKVSAREEFIQPQTV